jgi:hypothetical protein
MKSRCITFNVILKIQWLARTGGDLGACFFHPFIEPVQEPLALGEADHLFPKLGAVVVHRDSIFPVADLEEPFGDVLFATDDYLSTSSVFL